MTLINDSRRKVPQSHGHVVRILSVVFTVELEARGSAKGKPVCIRDLHVQQTIAKLRREQFRCQSDAIAPLLETSQFLKVLRLRRSLQLALPMGPHPLRGGDGDETRILAG